MNLNYVIFRLLAIALSCFFIVNIQGCKKGEKEKEKEKEKILSVVNTVKLVSITPSKFMLTGKILKGDYTISSYGFIYSMKPGVSESNGKKISLKNEFAGGEFSTEITDIFLGNTGSDQLTIYAKAFMSDENGIIYGEELSSEMPVSQPAILAPMFGKKGDKIKITGKFYSPELADIKVNFGGVLAKVISVSDSEILAEVPLIIGAFNGKKIPVSVINNGQSTLATQDFEIVANITDFTPKEGPSGTLVTLIGDNIDYGIRTIFPIPVFFGNRPAESSFDQTTVHLVPLNLESVKVPLYAYIRNEMIKLPGEFTLTAPKIESISPLFGIPGTRFTISGIDLPHYVGYGPELTGTIGGKVVDLWEAREQMTFNAPLDVEPGDHYFILNAGPNLVSPPQKIKILFPQITDITPRSGNYSTGITLKGSFLAGYYYDVYFNGANNFSYDSKKDGELTVYPSFEVSEGEIDITVKFGKHMISSGIKFKRAYPKLTSFFPASGKPGSKITIYGANFQDESNQLLVKFGDYDVLQTNMTNNSNQIVVSVPADAKPGKVKITVIFEDLFKSTTVEDFTIL